MRGNHLVSSESLVRRSNLAEPEHCCHLSSAALRVKQREMYPSSLGSRAGVAASASGLLPPTPQLIEECARALIALGQTPCY